MLDSFIPRDAQAIWTNMSSGRRLSILAAAVAGVALLAFFANMARSTEYTVAFSGLKDADAAAVVEKLKEKKIPYDIPQPGTIRVASSQAQEARLLAAAEGLTDRGGSVGFELFNQPHLGMTEFAEKINYQRALEGELARTIGKMAAVDSARVHLVIPSASLFVRDQKESTASIFIELKPGRKLDEAQISGITQLVASSVEGLKAQNVGGGSQGERRDTTTNYELSRSVERLVRAPGSVKRLSVAVALDSNVVADDEQANAIGRLVSTAAGLDMNRGDAVTLTSMPFTPAADQGTAQVAEGARQRELILTIARTAAMVVGPLLVAALLLMVLRRGRRSYPRVDISLPPALPVAASVHSELAVKGLPAPGAAEAERAKMHQELSDVA